MRCLSLLALVLVACASTPGREVADGVDAQATRTLQMAWLIADAPERLPLSSANSASKAH
jgi:hypothetical protein